MKHSQAMFIRSRKLIILLETVMLFSDNVQLIDKTVQKHVKVVLAVKIVIDASAARRSELHDANVL